MAGTVWGGSSDPREQIPSINEIKVNQSNELLNQIMYELNGLKNSKLSGAFFKDTYDICSRISQHLKNK